MRVRRALVGCAALLAVAAGTALAAGPAAVDPTAPEGRLDARAPVAHSGVVYSGRKNGVRIVFELNGHKLTPALISVAVVCVGGDRSHRRFEELRSRRFSITVDRKGRFHEFEERNDAFEFMRRKLVGRVTPKTIEGVIAVKLIQPARIGNEECHSGKSPHGPVEELSFRARRH